MMQKKSLYLCLIAIIFLSACATASKQENLSPGTYKTRVLGQNEFEVVFIPDRNIDKITIQSYALLKAATIVLENGYKYFSVLEQVSEKKFFNNKTVVKLTIACFFDIPQQTQENIYDAQRVKDYLELKYNFRRHNLPNNTNNKIIDKRNVSRQKHKNWWWPW